MFLLWTTKAEADLIRLHEFLDPVNPDAAARVVQQLVAAAGTLLIHQASTIYMLRLWHTREDR